MASRSYLSHLECSLCGKEYDAHRLQNLCLECHKPLIPRYDLDSLAEAWHKSDLVERPQSMWRYRELLPYQNEQKIVSLGEPFTPLLKLDRLGQSFGLNNLWIKDETALPTGTFKARGLAMAVTRAAELGVNRLAIPSAGNAAEALSAYAARAGIEAYVFMPKDAPIANQRVCEAAGAKLFLVDGLISDAGKIVREGIDQCGWLDLSTFKEPYRLEGKKTMGLELTEQLGWRVPDVIIYPTGGGTGLVGMWKAFHELEALGWIGSTRPRMIAVQSEGCAPIVRAFESGAEKAQFWEGASTIAGGLRVPGPLADRLILSAIRESGGRALAVPESSICDNLTVMSEVEGVLASPEGVTTMLAAKMLADVGEIGADEEVVLFNCGTLLKHMEILSDYNGPVLNPNVPIDYTSILTSF